MASIGLLIAFVLAVGLTPLARALASSWHVVDQPSGRKIHRRPTPLLGGLAVFGAVATTVLIVVSPTREILWVLLGGLVFLGIGLVDDVYDYGGGKLLLEIGVAWVIVTATGTVFHLPWPPLARVLTVLWIVGVANAFNCLDCADGVATAALLAAGTAFLTIALLTDQRPEGLLAAAIFGAALGFLPYNFHPASIFLGDAGSLAMGYLVGMLGVMLSPGVLSIPAMATPAVVLAIPIYDIILVHTVRYRRGQHSLRQLLTSTGRDHLPHRLMGRGLSPRNVALTILLASVITGGAGVALAAANSLFGALLIALAVVMALALLEREWLGVTPRSRDLGPRPGPENPGGP
jgi:UDP-GlcNAc:undecaprenyl-phosphate GlcNAc-1-phosphate transferase